MRRHIMSILGFIGLLAATAPQPVAAQQFGLLGGVTFSDISGDDAADNLDRTTGFLGGAFARLPLGQIITFQPEVQYVRKGAEGESLGSDVNVKLSYIDVPLFLSFGFPSSIGFHVMAGPNFSFEVGCTMDVDTALGETDSDCDDDDDFDSRKSFVAAAAVGAGINLPLGGAGLTVDGRFVIDLESFHESDNIDIRNQVFELVVGLALGGR